MYKYIVWPRGSSESIGQTFFLGATSTPMATPPHFAASPLARYQVA